MTRLAALLSLILFGACQTMPNSGLAHDVYFELVDASPAARQRLIDSCYEKLAPISGITFFAAGNRDAELTREGLGEGLARSGGAVERRGRQRLFAAQPRGSSACSHTGAAGRAHDVGILPRHGARRRVQSNYTVVFTLKKRNSFIWL